MDASNKTYDAGSRHIHHTMALLVIVLLIVGWSMTYNDMGTLKGVIYNAHKLAGLVALLLIGLRLVWRIKQPWIPLPNTIASWQIFLAHLVQYTLYFTMVLMPLSGWVMATASNHSPTWGTYKLAMPGIPINPLWAQFAGDVHCFSAWALSLAVGLHLAGALYHWHQQDGIIKRMFPKR